jgi:ssRNA-specific RNase YbeY (16S rRNA maturation enzyme)
MSSRLSRNRLLRLLGEASISNVKTAARKKARTTNSLSFIARKYSIRRLNTATMPPGYVAEVLPVVQEPSPAWQRTGSSMR